MKIGILTFHDALNYGAVLQAYALQLYLAQSTGAEVELINYKPNNQKSFLSKPFKSSNIVKQIAGDLIFAYYSRSLRLRNLRFSQFVKEYHNLSKRTYTSFDDFEKFCHGYSILVAGSDQVFNPKADSKIYYFGFNSGESKKIAYAPSIGLSELSSDQKEMIRPWIKDFNVLSCRESQGAKLLREISETEVPVVCDPVCLISKDQWLKVAQKPKNENYIFVYDLNGGKPLFDLALKLKKQTGLPLIYSSLNAIHTYVNSCKTRHDLGPAEWLGYINNASYVVTDSFHGTMLSLVLGTPVLNKISVASTSSRITSIMDRLGIKEQLVDDVTKFKLESINFNDYHQKLNEFIDYSKGYLNSAIKG